MPSAKYQIPNAKCQIPSANYQMPDWAVCSGNWMWVSSSAFEKSLNSSFCLDPTVYGWRVDPHGKYVKKYLPELAEMPVEFIYAPWRAPKEVC